MAILLVAPAGSSRGARERAGSPGSPLPDPSVRHAVEPPSKQPPDAIPQLTRRYAQHDPTRRVFFTITFEEKGGGAGVSWSDRTQVRYALLPTWDGSRGVDPGLHLSKGMKQRLGLRETGSAEELYELRGSFRALKPGDLLQFYGKEASGSGSGTLGNENHSWSQRTQDGVSTSIQDGHAYPSRNEYAWDADAQLLRTETGARLRFHWQNGSCQDMGVTATEAQWTPAPNDFLAFDLTEDDLRHWERITKVKKGSLSFDGDGGGTITATLSGGPAPEDEIEVSVEPEDGYETWVPDGNWRQPSEPGKQLRVTLKVHQKGDPEKPRKAKLVVSLPYVSKNKGICGNWPQGAEEKEGLRFREEDFPKQEGLLFKDLTHLETDIEVEEAAFKVHSYDYGAWGTLRVTAKDSDGKDLKVKVRGKDSPDLDIPLDEDANRIADAWEPGSAKHRPRDWDEETVAGQDSKGDGITLYNEYRGLVMPTDKGGRDHQRLKPNVKELFILDPSQEFLRAKWELITGIRAYRLEEALVDPKGNPGPGKSPLVNFNAPDKDAHGFYALKIVVRSDDSKDSEAPAYAQMADGTADGEWCVKRAIAVNIFPARFLRRIEEDFFWLDKAILEPDSFEGKELRSEGPAEQVSVEDARAAWNRLVDPAQRKAVAAKLQKAVFLHEVGHVCQTVDHKTQAPPGDEEAARACLMFLQGTWGWGRKRTLIHTALGRGDVDFAYPYRNFCRGLEDADFRCYRILKVKDW